MYGYIYLTENLINGKCYIGKHKSDKFDTYYIGSGKLLVNAIKKYGRNNFICSIICEADSEEDLIANEIYYIEKCKASTSDLFYNLIDGGCGGRPSSKPRKGYKCKKEDVEKRRQGIIAAYKRNGGSKLKGCKRPNISVKLKEYFKTHDHCCKNRPLPDDVKKKISLAEIGKRCGCENSMARKVVCVETNKVYNTLNDAAADVGLKSTGNISSCCRGFRHKAGGYS